MNLFIYIPTYNRPKQIRRQLDALYPEILARAKNVRMIVNDNCSPNRINDNLRKDYPAANLEFRNNPGNIGANANIALGFIFARQDEFLWILSDNDFLKPRALNFVLDHLDAHYDFMIFPHKDNEDTEIIYKWEEAQALMELGAGLISLVLYNMKSVSPFVEKAFYFHNSSFPHLAVILGTMKGLSIVKCKIYRKEYVFDFDPNDESHGGDYSLSTTGMPQLAILMEREAARRFCNSWIKGMWFRFYFDRSKHYFNYVMTLRVLTHYSGIRMGLLLLMNWPRYFVFLALVRAKEWMRSRMPSQFVMMKNLKWWAIQRLNRP